MYVSNTLRILNLPEEILTAIKKGNITEGHGRALLMVNDKPEEQNTLYRETLLKKLSVRDVERITRKIAIDKVRRKEWAGGADIELIAIERRFTETLGTRVQISKTDFGGKVTIDYFAPEDLMKILEKLGQSGEKPVQMPNLVDTPVVADTDAPTMASEKPGADMVMEEGSEMVEAKAADEPEEDLQTSDEGEKAPVDDRSKDEREEDDPELYAIKNFSL